MRYLFLLLFPSFLFASSEFNLPYDRKAKFLPVEQIVNPKLLKKDPVIIEGLELPEWLDQTIASELAPFGSYRAADLNGPLHDERCSCAHFRIREGQLTVRVPNYFLNPSQRPKVVVLCTAIYKLIHAKGSQLKNGDFLIYLIVNRLQLRKLRPDRIGHVDTNRNPHRNIIAEHFHEVWIV